MANQDTRPIGVFDSGVGGLSVLREIRALLPHESLLYCADSGHAPYGDKSQQLIRERSLELAEFLVRHEAKAIVIACNTATAAAARALRERWPNLPVIGMEPAVKPAAAATRGGTVGVLATVGTLASAQFAALLDTFGQDVHVVTQPGVGLVEAVERGELKAESTRHLLTAHLKPLLAAGADVIVLGCTHYVFLRELVETIVGPAVKVIDTGAAVARQLDRRLAEAGHHAPEQAPRAVRFWCSGNPASVAHAIEVLWGERIWPDPLARSQVFRPGQH
ncbi:glutamate racemase [Niveibacterium sp. 24ML]|uniref:glutamate racemase n=1 Tax=Niveibacterium sp. 24ML TaxID=2985512 RepID=UPI002270C5D7|nr:glutamate racemase [Niveibacterium sp. 24ML]MCX9158419.1 glutamate racemase [Niveibacterium sp. 24ML]